MEDVGKGVTKPQRLTLERDGETHRAIFKSIDVTANAFVRAGQSVPLS